MFIVFIVQEAIDRDARVAESEGEGGGEHGWQQESERQSDWRSAEAGKGVNQFSGSHRVEFALCGRVASRRAVLPESRAGVEEDDEEGVEWSGVFRRGEEGREGGRG